MIAIAKRVAELERDVARLRDKLDVEDVECVLDRLETDELRELRSAAVAGDAVRCERLFEIARRRQTNVDGAGTQLEPGALAPRLSFPCQRLRSRLPRH